MARTSDLSGAITSAMGAISDAIKKKAAGNRVDIYIKEKSGGREIRVPWLPEEIEYKSGGITVASYDIMNRGTVDVPTGTGLREVSWESQFPGALRTDDALLRGEWQSPEYYHNILEDWRNKGTKLNLLVTGYPINFDVKLEDYKAKASGGFGDLEYSVTFTEYRDITITSTTTSSSTSSGTSDKDTTTEQKRPAEQTTSYTIKKGDSMWAIAQKYLGSGAKWPKLYEANAEILDSTAKKYGHSSSENGRWIFPGTKITIPQQ